MDGVSALPIAERLIVLDSFLYLLARATLSTFAFCAGVFFAIGCIYTPVAGKAQGLSVVRRIIESLRKGLTMCALRRLIQLHKPQSCIPQSAQVAETQKAQVRDDTAGT